MTDGPADSAATAADGDIWLTRLAHDLRNQLAPMRTAAQLLRDPRLQDARRDEMLELVDRQIQRMVRMLDDVSEYAYLRIGRRKPRERIDLGFVVDAAVSEFGRRLRDAQVSLDQQLPEARVPIDCERQRLTAAVARLLDNAIRATSPGGTVALRIEVSGTHASIRVQDTGAGIAADSQERVFALPEAPRSGEGLGISLYLARACARDHGGDLRVYSDGAGRGATFELTLPLGVG